MRKVLLLLASSLAAFAQSATVAPTPLENAQLPAYVMGGISCNQFRGCAGFVSGIVPEVNKVGLYGSVTVDITPVKFTDPQTGKEGVGLSPNVRLGQHKLLIDSGKNVFTLGGDLGASFSQTGTPAAVSIGMAGSFTATYIRRLGAHWFAALPVRMLWVSNVGPNSIGVWNPVVEVGAGWQSKPKQ